jgi:hypothetical protein
MNLVCKVDPDLSRQINTAPGLGIDVIAAWRIFSGE